MPSLEYDLCLTPTFEMFDYFSRFTYFRTFFLIFLELRFHQRGHLFPPIVQILFIYRFSPTCHQTAYGIVKCDACKDGYRGNDCGEYVLIADHFFRPVSNMSLLGIQIVQVLRYFCFGKGPSLSSSIEACVEGLFEELSI